jgi:hypothetical protein
MLILPFLTYAQYVAVDVGAMALPAPALDPRTEANTQVSIGFNSKKTTKAGHKGIITVERLLTNHSLYGLQPSVAVGFSPDGLFYLTAGVKKHFNFGTLDIAPNFGPALYTSNINAPAASELIQFRTGIDFGWRIGKSTYAELGFYHMSNAKITNNSAGQDVYKASLSWKW